MLDVDNAAELVMARIPVLGVERVDLARAADRVLAADVAATAPLPPFPTSAVDGYAFRASDAGRRLTVVGESAAGRPYTGSIAPGQAIRILTGAVLPDDADTVVMVERTEQGDGWVHVPESANQPGRNFHRVGDDVDAGEVVLRAGQVLGAAEIGLVASLGIAEVPVRQRPRVALVTTGDELVEVGQRPGPGQIVDSNRWALLAALQEAGADVDVRGIAPDDEPGLRTLLEDALRGNDVLVTSGGVSVGTHDLVKPMLAAMGEVHIGRVKLKPGKPFTFATLPGDRLAFGLPGFPVSSLVTFEVFVRPALRRMQGHPRPHRPALPVRLGFPARRGDRTEYQRVRLRREGAEVWAETTGSQSSSRLLSLAGADALVRIPTGEGALDEGATVDALILTLP
jgi:molybdopterin molybdotransferase